MDLTSILGLILGVGGILGGQIMEGGHVGSIIQDTAAIIVFGGTFGAVLLATPMSDVKTGLNLLKTVFINPKGDDINKIIKELIKASQIPTKKSILALK